MSESRAAFELAPRPWSCGPLSSALLLSRSFLTAAARLVLSGLLSQTFQNDTQVQHAQQRASFEVRKAKRPDYYALLQVPSIASGVEIKQAYKQQALLWHPDKHQQSDEARRAAEERFKLLGEALEILTDDFQRKLYVEGYDKDAIQERVQAANRAANSHDRDGCCNRGGGCGGGGCG